MGERTLRAGAFGLTVHVPDGLTSKLRRIIGHRNGPDVARGRAQSDRRLEIGPVPAVGFERRDPDHGLAFVRERLACRTYDPEETPHDEVEDGPEALARLVEGRPWYHTIELPHGIVTQGAYDHRALVPHYGIPSDLRGKRVLDLASADGFWAFEFERRGAEVTALDIETTADVDLPLPVRQRAAELGLSDTIIDGFKLAKRVLKSGVEHLTGTIYDLDPARLGQFDLVHTGDVLLHLRDPLGALEQIPRVTRGEALLSDVFDPRLTSSPGGEGLPAMYLGGGNAAWWRPGLATLVQMVADSGFSDVEVVTTYNLAAWGQEEGPWRAVLRAKP